MAEVCLVVPVYEEEGRLNTEDFRDFLCAGPTTTNLKIIFVDDGSTDNTQKLLKNLIQTIPKPNKPELITLPKNMGKAEAVRVGMLHAIEQTDNLKVVGFWDSDLATPLQAVPQLLQVLRDQPQIEMVFGARVALLGRRIVRKAKRHYAGRVFATLASLVLSLPIYDTQCGAKLFRVTPALRTVLTQRFLTRWVFDVEIIARFAALYRESSRELSSRESSVSTTSSLSETIFEFPLHEWQDVAGSKLSGTDVMRMAGGLVRIYYTYVLHDWPSGKPVPDLWIAARRHSAALAALIGISLSVFFMVLRQL